VVLVAVVVLGLVTACSSGRSDPAPGAPSATTAEARRVRLIAPDGLVGILRRERSRAKDSATTTVPATTTTVAAAPAGVARLSATFVDPSRGSPARGGAASSSRTIDTTIYYPTAVPPSATNETPPAYRKALPLVVFAHGFAIDAASYETLLRDLAAGGYVVAAPDFPGTSTAYPGPAIREDSLQQPADISFVITSVLAMAGKPGPLSGAVSSSAIGVSGQSDGGVTALASGWNTCCTDTRIKAGAILTGAAFAFDGQWFPPGSPPVLFVHATADEVNPYSASTSMFQQAQSPKYLLTIEGGSHLEVYVDPPWEPQVAHAMVAFFDQYLRHDPDAAARLHEVGNQPPLSLQTG
jgi:predicted dienelactone hydrolase